MKYQEPFTDDIMEWDGNQYVLTRQFIKKNYDTAYRDDAVLDRRRKKNSRVVYSVITARLAQVNTKMGLWLLSHTEEGRTFMRDILAEQMEADLDGGYNDLGLTSAINVANGQVIDRDEITKNLLCVNASMMMESATNYFPFNPFVQYQYTWGIQNYIYGIGFKG